jgi:transposase InsO family protein
VKKLRSDGGGEYVCNALQSFLCAKGIVHEKTPPYHPQQNGAAERLNRTLLDRARAMMLGAQLPLSTWAEVLNAACVLCNCTPCSSIDLDLLYEVFWKTPAPSLKQLRAYGCPALVLNLGLVSKS